MTSHNNPANLATEAGNVTVCHLAPGFAEVEWLAAVLFNQFSIPLTIAYDFP